MSSNYWCHVCCTTVPATEATAHKHVDNPPNPGGVSRGDRARAVARREARRGGKK